jgi:hypothetical protein
MSAVAARTPGWGSVVTGTAAVFGIIVSGAVLGVAVAGFLQWGPTLASALDDGLPLAVVGLGMVLAGRVAVDVAGRRGVLCTVGAAGIVTALGITLSRSSEAHGDGIEVYQVLVATAVVLVLSGGTAVFVAARRTRHTRRADGSD